MVQNIASLTYQAISPKSNKSVAKITLDPNVDLTWNVKLLGNVQDGSRNVEPKFLSVDNISGSVGITVSLAGFSYRTPAYTREPTFTIPDGTQQCSFQFDAGAVTPVTIFISEDSIAAAANDQLKVQQQAAKTLVYNYVTYTATVSQSLNDGNTNTLFTPILGAMNYNLLPISTAPVANGFLQYLSNNGNYPVSIVPAGANKINGLFTAAAPLALSPGDAGVFSCDGTTWYYHGKNSFEGAQQAVVGGALNTFPHKLVAKPKEYAAFLINVTAEGNYVAGDEVALNNAISYAQLGGQASDAGIALYCDATNVYVRFGSSVTLMNKTAGAFNITAANWKVIARAIIHW